MLDAVPDDGEQMLKSFGVAAPERAFERLQDALQSPTLNVRGLTSGHVGAGARTIIPDRATAAIDVRLVKETRAEDLVEKIRAHIQRPGLQLVNADPDDVDAERLFPDWRRCRCRRRPPKRFARRRRSAGALARGRSRASTWRAPPVRLRTLGGTVPIAPFIEALGFPAVVLPTVNFDNNQHEENENLRLGQFFQAIEIIAIVHPGLNRGPCPPST